MAGNVWGTTERDATEVISTPFDDLDDWKGAHLSASTRVDESHHEVLPDLFLRAVFL
jgi:hypothetical protein